MAKRIILNGCDSLGGEPLSMELIIQRLSAMYAPQSHPHDIADNFQQLLKYGYIQVRETETDIHIVVPSGTYSMMTGGAGIENKGKTF